MEKLLKNLSETRDFIFSKSQILPKLGIVFGSGLSSEELLDTVEAKIEYKHIPHFPVSTVDNHKGELVIGKRNGKGIYILARIKSCIFKY